MAIRFKVIRGKVQWRKQVFNIDELMPKNFTERDRARNVYSSRLMRVEVPDEPITIDTPNELKVVPNSAPVKIPDKVPASAKTPTTGTITGKTSPVVKPVTKVVTK